MRSARDDAPASARLGRDLLRVGVPTSGRAIGWGPGDATRDPTRHFPGCDRVRSGGTSRHEHHHAQLTHARRESATPRPVASRRGSASPDHPAWRELFDERAPLIGAPAFYGPPITFLLGPWLLLVLLLIGPFALILTILVVLAAAAGVLAVVAAVIASPYLLVRHLHGHGMAHAKPRAPRYLFHKHRAGSGRLGSLQPKGMS